MAQLKAVVFSLRNVFFDEAHKKIDVNQIQRLIKLINYLSEKGIRVILHSNDRWYMREDKQITLADHLSKITRKEIKYYNAEDFPSMPRKPKAGSIPYILHSEELFPNEIIYVGCNKNDWLSCINAKILFIKANWIKDDEEIPYGVSFDDMAALARFIDICCIKANQTDLIKYKDNYLEYYTLSPFSTIKPQLGAYSASAKSTAKKLTHTAEPDFWLMLLVAKIYFSGLYDDIQTIISFPGHKPGFGNPVMDDALDVFTKCFRISYLHNALIRHKESVKSQTARQQGKRHLLSIYNHLNTLQLNRNPKKYGTEKSLVSNPYKDKTILLIDDIATAGFSLDAASLLLKRAGARRVISFSWLKTINTPFQIARLPLPKDYPVYEIVHESEKLYPDPDHFCISYNSIMSYSAGYEMSKLFEDFINWEEDIYS